MITEVMYRGSSKERIEITNVSSQPFDGDITIIGAIDQKKQLSVHIDPGAVIVIADDSTDYIGPEVKTYVLPDFNIVDPNPTVSLVIGNEVIDVFWFDQTVLNQSQPKTSFTRTFGTDWTYLLAHTLYNTGMVATATYTANPGVVYTSTGVQVFPQPIIVPPTPPESCNQKLLLTEIHTAQETVGDYIEIMTQKYITGTITLT